MEFMSIDGWMLNEKWALRERCINGRHWAFREIAWLWCKKPYFKSMSMAMEVLYIETMYTRTACSGGVQRNA
jgi:hypothetical protein